MIREGEILPTIHYNKPSANVATDDGKGTIRGRHHSVNIVDSQVTEGQISLPEIKIKGIGHSSKQYAKILNSPLKSKNS